MTGPRLRQLRRQLGLTQVALARAIGMTSTSVARYERGEVPIPEPVARLVTLLAQQAPRPKEK
jgi:transcriptional regulator with XRE-family HTH domain